MKNVYEVQAGNKIKSAVIVVLFLAFSFLTVYILTNALGYYMGYQPGGFGYAGMALIISGISSFVSYYYSDKIVLGISGARRATPREDKLFSQVAENLAIGVGIPKPTLYVIEDSAPNAFATGRDPKHAVICATTGLLDKLDRTELEGVIAHEMTHIKDYDIRLMSVVSVMVGLIALLGDWFTRSMWWGGRRRDDDEGSSIGSIFMVLGIVFAILSPIIATLIQLAVSRRREFMADAGSVEITHQPQGLISALEKISGDNEPLEAANKATAHMYIVNPFKSDKISHAISTFANLFNTHPPIQERIKILEQMS